MGSSRASSCQYVVLFYNSVEIQYLFRADSSLPLREVFGQLEACSSIRDRAVRCIRLLFHLAMTRDDRSRWTPRENQYLSLCLLVALGEH